MSFDRAAGYYDATRSLSPGAMAQVVGVLAEALVDHQPVLEIGVGTGRVALPLAELGIEIVGIDLSGKMLRKLREKDDTSVPVGRADCTRLPFPDDRFGAVVASHVFHLVPDWPRAVDEAFRVLRPGGVLLHSRGGIGERTEGAAEAFADGAGLSRTPVGLDDPLEVDRHLGRDGEWLQEVVDDRQFTLEDVIRLFESGAMGWTWPATDEERRQGGEAARAWAAAEGLPLDRPERVDRPVRFRRYVAS